MKNLKLKQKLHQYIEMADEKKLKAIYVMVEDEIEEKYDIWNNKDFVAEIERRTSEMENGSAKTYTWDEVQQHAKQAVEKARSK